MQSSNDQKSKTVTMEFESVSRTSEYRTDHWRSLVGEIVEVRRNGQLYRHGLVDAAMADASGLWIAQEGAVQREFIDARSGFEVWTNLYPRSRDNEAASEMVAEPAEVPEKIVPSAGGGGPSHH